ncbi:MAG TPA: hypothetical protein PLL61_08925 [Thiobacillus sp.]|jgi:hypothetical protein|nr:hypothetical protein [Thiobacillus sp.]
MVLLLDTHILLWVLDAPEYPLIAQALLMPAQLLTADSALVPYSELVRLI